MYRIRLWTKWPPTRDHDVNQDDGMIDHLKQSYRLTFWKMRNRRKPDFYFSKKLSHTWHKRCNTFGKRFL